MDAPGCGGDGSPEPEGLFDPWWKVWVVGVEVDAATMLREGDGRREGWREVGLDVAGDWYGVSQLISQAFCRFSFVVTS